MIEYKIVTVSLEKQKLKNDFQTFFKSVYERELSDSHWEHQFLHSPYEDSALFLAFDNENIVGSALMIPQKYLTDTSNGSYYLWTTSAVAKEYRSKGVYAQLLSMQREYATKNKKDFIFAFPNKLAYPVVKLFGGFKDLDKTHLVKTTIDMLDLTQIENSLVIDKDFFKWRFEHHDYLFYEFQEHILISKKFGDTLDILAIYKKNELKHLDMTISNELPQQNIITMRSFLNSESEFDILDQLNGTYFPINKNIDYNNVKLNLLMSDVF